jgi:hypothetical protein
MSWYHTARCLVCFQLVPIETIKYDNQEVCEHWKVVIDKVPIKKPTGFLEKLSDTLAAISDEKKQQVLTKATCQQCFTEVENTWDATSPLQAQVYCTMNKSHGGFLYQISNNKDMKPITIAEAHRVVGKRVPSKDCDVCLGTKLVPVPSFKICNNCQDVGGLVCTHCSGVYVKTNSDYYFSCQYCKNGFTETCQICNGAKSIKYQGDKQKRCKACN